MLSTIIVTIIIAVLSTLAGVLAARVRGRFRRDIRLVSKTGQTIVLPLEYNVPEDEVALKIDEVVGKLSLDGFSSSPARAQPEQRGLVPGAERSYGTIIARMEEAPIENDFEVINILAQTARDLVGSPEQQQAAMVSQAGIVPIDRQPVPSENAIDKIVALAAVQSAEIIDLDVIRQLHEQRNSISLGLGNDLTATMERLYRA